jgi:hypothetical protein
MDGGQVLMSKYTISCKIASIAAGATLSGFLVLLPVHAASVPAPHATHHGTTAHHGMTTHHGTTTHHEASSGTVMHHVAGASSGTVMHHVAGASSGTVMHHVISGVLTVMVSAPAPHDADHDAGHVIAHHDADHGTAHHDAGHSGGTTHHYADHGASTTHHTVAHHELHEMM